MLVDRGDPVRLLDLVPRSALQREPESTRLDRLLEDDALFRRVKADLARRAPLLPVEAIVQMLVVRRL